ncbi:unnamed protein product [Phytophthora lilii]|uniref:Unnamed protein product n=1 Tax=Phytophthora lilii TaxID=2077276 RepID=A0A9W6XBF7_9STRA|nr:unnamed protein product [Phytophthora lilii]
MLTRVATAIVCKHCLPEKGGSLPHVMQCIDEYLTPFLSEEVFTEACEKGMPTQTLAFLLQRAAPVWKEAIKAATRGGHLRILRWATELEGCRRPWRDDFDNALDVAATHGHIDVVKWLLKRGVERHSIRNMNESAPGYCEQTWRYKYCIGDALDLAAENTAI